MTYSRNPWEARFQTVLSTVQWVTLALAAFFEFFRSGITPLTSSAAALAGIYVIGSTALPRHVVRRPVVREIVSLVGSALVMTAVALTGAIDSMYLLLSLSPVLFAAAFGGIRIGVATAALSFASLTALTVAEAEQLPYDDLLLWAALYLVVAVAFSQARRILIEEAEAADAMAAESMVMSERVKRLERSHDLLSDLARTAEGAELNPMAVGDAALVEIAGQIEYEAGIVALAGNEGPVVVARRGGNADSTQRTMIPLSVKDREVGLVVLYTPKELTPRQLEDVDDAVRPISLAFSNILLLQDIARAAIREERTRLARELHDEIGPSLASLGLALDLALIQHPTEPDLQAHLEQLRGSVGGLVEEVRSTVADLRIAEPTSLTVTVQRLAAGQANGGPNIVVKLNEHRPPRPAMAPEISAIVTEAIRNAVRHSQGQTVIVHGEVDFDKGKVTVHDDGSGFDRNKVPVGHFGLLGMEERAQKIGASLNITSTKNGTAVSVAWGPD